MSMLNSLTTLELIYLSIGIVAFAITLIVFIKARRTIGYKHMMFKLKRIDYADTIFLLEGGGYQIDALPIITQGQRLHLQGKGNQYGYAPLANGLAILEENNAIPVVRGGWIPQTVETKAKTELKITTDTELTEEETTRVFKWAINAGKLKSTLIRPLVRWSSKELDNAIKSKVIEELLDIPLKMIDVATLLAIIAVLGVTVIYGFQNNQVLQAILEQVTESPYIPIP